MESTGKKLSFIKADPRAPRFIKEKYDPLKETNTSFFKRLKKAHPELKKYSNREIGRYIKAVNLRVSKEVIENRNGVRLPEGLGIIVAGACKLNNDSLKKNIDYATSQKLGKIVYYQNQSSDQFIAKIKYSNEMDKHMFDNHEMWCFDACRPLCAALSKEFKKESGYKKYIVFTSKQSIAHLFRKTKIQKVNKVGQELTKINLAAHNEFDI